MSGTFGRVQHVFVDVGNVTPHPLVVCRRRRESICGFLLLDDLLETTELNLSFAGLFV